MIKSGKNIVFPVMLLFIFTIFAGLAGKPQEVRAAGQSLLAGGAGAAAAGESLYELTVFLNGKQLTFDQEPILVENRILVPLRKIAESLGATVVWTGVRPQVTVQKGDTVIGLNIGSNEGFTNNRQIFFLEQPPIIVNGRTMVPLRFLSETLGAKVDWDEKGRTVSISDGDFMKSNLPEVTENGQGKPDADKYYKLYDAVVGPDYSPSVEEAKAYVLEQGLLKIVKDVQFTPTRFIEYGPTDTMVIGNDESGREKAVWLTKNQYTGDISLTGSVLMNDGVSKETIYSKLEEKGIRRESVQKIYIAPYEKNQIDWFVFAEQENKRYYYCFDYKTGEMVIENIFRQ
ncbi:Protease inhibitor [Pelotomaculum propionicicum]|uniref:Protease inhibitor n=2 Tax=Pelotomaculum propionicicum TaxID=258475 RepID=A0A4Y7RP49_9FIRM|nr:Protease inhibitor [Pelotomaculum propionicicum]